MKNKNGLDSCTSACGAALRMAGFIALTAVMAPIHLAYISTHPDDPFRVPQIYYRILLRVLGLRVRMHGQMETKRPVMFVSNHTSYLDVPVLGALIPAAFVAKSEVANWPFIGGLAKIQGTIFIERRAARAADQRDFLNGHLIKGQSFIIFPEGTSTVGLSVLPFKSSLFGVVEAANKDITIQPISVSCTELDGLPMTRAWRPFYAWYGDMTFFGHFWSVCKMGRFTVDVIFHPPSRISSFAGRKELASYCQQQVARGIEQCVTGRDIDKAEVPRLPAPAQI